MPALVRTAAEGIGQISIHRTINASVARAARIKARIISGSLMPGVRSTPEEMSTPPARVTRTASATLPALRPPDTMNGSLRSRFLSTCQSNTAPRPPGRGRKEHEPHHIRAGIQRDVERLARGQAANFDDQGHVQGTGWSRKSDTIGRVLQRRALLVSPAGPISAALPGGRKALRVVPRGCGAMAQVTELGPC